MIDYRADLLHRFWEYQETNFVHERTLFDARHVKPSSPPVFIRSKARHNIITNPTASEQEKAALFRLIPEGDFHKWYRSMTSSQALAQSILGNLAIYDALGHLSELNDDDGIPLFGEAQISSDNFAMEYKVNCLGEPRPTSLDGFIAGNYRIAIECKFTETAIGSCSRPRLRPAHSNYESEHCTGVYSKQRSRRERCSLTEAGVLYWQYVPNLFKWKNEIDLNPCPLNNNYQLVRNILAAGVKPDGSVSINNGHVVLIYDERNPAFQNTGKGMKAYGEVQQALQKSTTLRKCSWQRIIQHIRELKILPWLTEALALKYGL